jgi:Na+/phosphate symporter
VPVTAIEDVMAERTRQIVKFGHTLERDREQKLMPMVKQVVRLLSGAIDYVHFHKLELARRYLVRTAAMCLACIDWIDAELEADHAGDTH